MDWLRAWKVPFVRINGTDIDSGSGLSFTIGSEEMGANIYVDDVPVNVRSMRVVWYRRWAHNHKYRQSVLFAAESHRNHSNFLEASNHFGGELRAVSSFFFISLEKASWLGHP